MYVLNLNIFKILILLSNKDLLFIFLSSILLVAKNYHW